MSRIPSFIEALDIMRKVHETKNEDYANTENPFSNFDASEYGLRMFPNPRDGAFIWPIFTKLARLATLLAKTDKPNHESIEDTLIDIANYVLLWRSDYLNRKQNELMEGVKRPGWLDKPQPLYSMVTSDVRKKIEESETEPHKNAQVMSEIHDILNRIAPKDLKNLFAKLIIINDNRIEELRSQQSKSQ